MELNKLKERYRRTTQRVLQSIGMAERTVDEDFVQAMSEFGTAGEAVRELTADTRNTLRAIEMLVSAGAGAALHLRAAEPLLCARAKDVAVAQEDAAAGAAAGLLHSAVNSLYDAQREIGRSALPAAVALVDRMALGPLLQEGAEDDAGRETSTLLAARKAAQLDYDGLRRSAPAGSPQTEEAHARFEHASQAASAHLRERTVARVAAAVYALVALVKTLKDFHDASAAALAPIAELAPLVASVFGAPGAAPLPSKPSEKPSAPTPSTTSTKPAEKTTPTTAQATPVPIVHVSLVDMDGSTKPANGGVVASPGSFMDSLLSSPTTPVVPAPTTATKASSDDFLNGIMLGNASSAAPSQADTHRTTDRTASAPPEKKPVQQQQQQQQGTSSLLGFDTFVPPVAERRPSPKPSPSIDLFGTSPSTAPTPIHPPPASTSSASFDVLTQPQPHSQPEKPRSTAGDLDSMFGVAPSTSASFASVFSGPEFAAAGTPGMRQQTPPPPTTSSPDGALPTKQDVDNWAAKGGRKSNLRALLSSLPAVLWPSSGWKPVTLAELVDVQQVKELYHKAVTIVHPDKVEGARRQELARHVFAALREAYNEFKKELAAPAVSTAAPSAASATAGSGVD